RPNLIDQVVAELTQATLKPLSADDFERLENQEIFRLLQMPGTPGSLPVNELVPEPLQAHWDRLRQAVAEMPSLSVEQAVREITEAVLRLRVERVRRSLEELKQLLAEAQGTEDREAVRDYTQLVQERTREIGQLQLVLARRAMIGSRA
ncbi:MAG: hypothetical protein J7M34_08290, partial [Anaerolineae bacterium]|nr:hypothetical protein [Anaerolineae bacterium]